MPKFGITSEILAKWLLDGLMTGSGEQLQNNALNYLAPLMIETKTSAEFYFPFFRFNYLLSNPVVQKLSALVPGRSGVKMILTA